MIYVDEGKGPAIVLVHGWALDLTMWDLVASALRSRYRVIRYDRRGFGGSTGQPDLQRDADDLMTLLIPGHETTAAVLTWPMQCVVDDEEVTRKLTTVEVTRRLTTVDVTRRLPAVELTKRLTIEKLTWRLTTD